MTETALARLYHGYIDCQNRQGWDRLGDFVRDDVTYNGTRIGLAGYRAMLERDFRAIPDLKFRIDCLAADPPLIAARLAFDCTPAGMLFDLPVNGRRVRFAEHVFYTYVDDRIGQVRSIIDIADIARQL